MPSWTTQRRKALHRDGEQCQICGHTPPSPHCALEVHHICPRSEGGTDNLDNLVTLCDLCHAVRHTQRASQTRQIWHKGPAWCGVAALPLNQQAEARTFLRQAQKEFHDFLTLPLSERYAIQDKMWERWGITPKGRNPAVPMSAATD